MERRTFILQGLGWSLGSAVALTGPHSLAQVLEPLASDQGPAASQVRLPPVDPVFAAWRSDFIARAVAAGWPETLLHREMDDLTPDPRVLALDGRQPELSKPIGAYVQGVVAQDRIVMGQSRRENLPWLAAIEERFGVPDQILIAIWGVETGFGAVLGDFDVLRSMATLAAQGRRRDWAEAQIYAALRMLATRDVTRAQLRGSWAGAMGQTQFLPETYVRTALDFDGDGRRDIWGSSPDALASAASLLVKGGWKRDQPWAREVLLASGFDVGLAEGPLQSVQVWAALGVAPADGLGWAQADGPLEATLILPAGATGPAFLVFANHMAIRTYNNAMAYALAVGLLADRIAGGAGLVTPWPVETPLSLADRTGAQNALLQLGYDVGAADGVIGLRTRKALRAWQKAVGLPADGYLTVALAQTLAQTLAETLAAAALMATP
jgi:lytic murein transglycosylase